MTLYSPISAFRYHAELRNSVTDVRDHDLQSHNGILVTGERISSAAVTERDIIGIGLRRFASSAASCANWPMASPYQTPR